MTDAENETAASPSSPEGAVPEGAAPESTAPESTPPESAVPESAAITRLLDVLDHHVLGQREAAEQLLACYLAGGHALLEGVPGIGKTLLARCFAAALGLDFQRVQFTPDLMPSDVVGTNVFEQDRGGFHLVRGPVFTQFLMADEINRTPPKTQSALLEAMQELQVTIDGERYGLDGSFFVVATQNPVEFEGTYPLPEAQLDRFLLRIEMGLPSKVDELSLYRLAVTDAPWGHDAMPEAQLDAGEAARLRRLTRQVHVADELLDYLYRLVDAARKSPQLELGVSPRGALALLEAARAFAVIEGRSYVVPDDLKRGLEPCWGHRLLLGAEAELEGHSSRRVLEDLATSVDVPHRAGDS